VPRPAKAEGVSNTASGPADEQVTRIAEAGRTGGCWWLVQHASKQAAEGVAAEEAAEERAG
jgi:hypothetical protein